MSTLNVDTLANELGTGGPNFVGMPTVAGDPVVESGSNTDGEWVRLADGTQLCTHFLDAPGFGTTNLTFGNIFASNPVTWAFPLAFISGAVRVSSEVRKLAGTGIVWSGVGTGTLNATQFSNIRLVSGNNDGEGDVRVIAHGRWK